MPRYNQDDDDDNYEENLKYMYPEPGLRDTFVPGVYIDSHTQRKYLSPERAMQNNPYYALGTTYSQQRTSSLGPYSQSFKNATMFGRGHPPSYGRIIGLSRRLDKGVNERMRYIDSMKDHEDAINQLINDQKQSTGYNKPKRDYAGVTFSPRQHSQFQKSALNVINN